MLKKLFIVVPLGVVLLAGCEASKPARIQYQSELRQLTPGQTTLEQFNALFPNAVLAGQNVVDGRRVDAYELNHSVDAWKVGQGFTSQQDNLWFYFNDSRLVKWGSPGDWPRAADFVTEVRVR